jgi:hypothetical protein
MRLAGILLALVVTTTLAHATLRPPPQPPRHPGFGG